MAHLKYTAKSLGVLKTIEPLTKYASWDEFSDVYYVWFDKRQEYEEGKAPGDSLKEPWDNLIKYVRHTPINYVLLIPRRACGDLLKHWREGVLQEYRESDAKDDERGPVLDILDHDTQWKFEDVFGNAERQNFIVLWELATS